MQFVREGSDTPIVPVRPPVPSPRPHRTPSPRPCIAPAHPVLRAQTIVVSAANLHVPRPSSRPSGSAPPRPL